MDVLVDRCCGLDVHQRTVVACVKMTTSAGKVQKIVRTFRTVTAELEELLAWLLSLGVTHVGMESTGVYWMPVYSVLATGELELIVGNAAHIKNVPGRKTDVKDAEWLAHLVRHGLIAPSVVPTPMMQRLRTYTRGRRKLVEERSRLRNRILRELEMANIKISSFASDVFGVSGKLMLDALLDGEMTPEQMAGLARGVLRKKRADLALALRGNLEEHNRFMLRVHRDRIAQIDEIVKQLDERIDAELAKHASVVDRLVKIPGVDRVTAAVILAEIGTDVSYWTTHAKLAAWAGLSPGSRRSAGKKLGRERARHGNVHLRTALTQAATSACKTKGTHFREKYTRVLRRQGAGKAVIATAHSILTAVFHVLRGADYEERGPYEPTPAEKAALARRFAKRIEKLGYAVTLEAA